MTVEERLDFIEFRMDLLREGTEFTKFIYDCNVTKSQLDELYDILDDIQGIGEKRKKALLAHFKDIDAIKKASVEELASVEGMNTASAESVYNFFKKG